VPLEGVDLYCDSCGSPVGHTRVTSDAQGFYSFAWSRNGLHPLLVTKAGFDVAPAIAVKRDALTFVNVIVNGDTRYDVELVRR
jgi:hypothetical protein